MAIVNAFPLTLSQLQHSLRNATLELNLERSKHSVEVVAKDEEIRKLRVAQCLLQDDNSDLHEQLEEEQARSDELESALDEALTQLDERHAEGETAQNTIRTQAREIANLRVGTFSLLSKAQLTLYRPSSRLWRTSRPTPTRFSLTNSLYHVKSHHYGPRSNTCAPRLKPTLDCSLRS
ncbi:hypothetical protein A1F94_001631 [Pyrenophora tritici-repentis]|nr:hypothetical protein A1F99_022380 [Pyrenophora tritici-repentis]KAG9388738.1 hypothetical protein A1F94_001631 [Pyrenophora tritici-repentis]